jgi:hypothetical protein
MGARFVDECDVGAASFAERLPETGSKFEAARAAAHNDDPMESRLSFRLCLVKRRLPHLRLGRHQGADARLAFPARDIDFLGNGSRLRLLRDN